MHFALKSCKKALKSYDFKAFSWSEWRDLNSRPLDPQSSALPAAPHPVVPKLNLLSTYRLSADSPRRFLQKHSRGTSLEALVPLLVSSPQSNAFIRHRRRHFSSPSCATPGKLINNTTRKAFWQVFFQTFLKTRQLFYFYALSLYFSASSVLKSKVRKGELIMAKIIGANIPDIPWEDKPAGFEYPVWRYSGIPL